MTCADAWHRILVSDISALRGESDRVLGAHLDGCPACAAAASMVVGETARLRVALATRARQPESRRASRRRNAFIIAPIGVAAAIMLIATHRSASTRPEPTRLASASIPALVTSVSDGDTDVVLPPPAGAAEVSSRAVAAASRRQSMRPAGSRPEGAMPTPVEANVHVDQPMPEVGVTVGDNQRAAIIATSNPRITVIWLSRGQQP